MGGLSVSEITQSLKYLIYASFGLSVVLDDGDKAIGYDSTINLDSHCSLCSSQKLFYFQMLF